jgi:hypothetical protein
VGEFRGRYLNSVDDGQVGFALIILSEVISYFAAEIDKFRSEV